MDMIRYRLRIIWNDFFNEFNLKIPEFQSFLFYELSFLIGGARSRVDLLGF